MKLNSGFRILGLLSLSVGAILITSHNAVAVECAPGTVKRDAEGKIAECRLAQSWRFAQRLVPQNSKPSEEFICEGLQPIQFYRNGAVATCTLDRPITIVQGKVREQCPVGKRVFFTEQGLLAFPNWCR